MNYTKYRPAPTVDLPDRQWPNNVLTEAPEWVSVDLRDGNQALEIPMSLEEKLDFYHHLINIGFKTIEIGFPAASQTEYDFCRYLIEHDLIPDDVALQVLTQARAHIIDRTMEAIAGAPKAVIHLYNSTSVVQRDVVFRMNRAECINLALSGTKMVKDRVDNDTSGTKFSFEYSPESYSGTEDDFAVEICDAVCEVWQPTPENKIIINLPTTVEVTMPNVYADRIEYFLRNSAWSDSVSLSIHAHNDRGTGVATTELGLLAGADRVEGTLFGNGERTGNADIVTIAMNLFSHGVDPKLDFSQINKSIEVYERNTRMTVSPRHPYAGSLVYTAFSGSHQDAISKGMAIQNTKRHWAVPYLPIDPADVGRNYEAIIRINSQSGRGGIDFVLEQQYGLQVPKKILQMFSGVVKQESDEQHAELSFDEIYELFFARYVNITEPVKLVTYGEEMLTDTETRATVTLDIEGEKVKRSAVGNGLVAAFCSLLEDELQTSIQITSYHQHAMTTGRESKAITYVMIKNGNGKDYIGAGISGSISKSSLRA
ncbi:MAG TPA: 2-isopropylmalate synthase, partial [Clostridiaceae bacterium]|nr:2-isopropylmalate synthase [Clostridiaceae bacterium]